MRFVGRTTPFIFAPEASEVSGRVGTVTNAGVGGGVVSVRRSQGSRVHHPELPREQVKGDQWTSTLSDAPGHHATGWMCSGHSSSVALPAVRAVIESSLVVTRKEVRI